MDKPLLGNTSAAVGALMDEGGQPEKQKPYKETPGDNPIHKAAREGDLGEVRRLVERTGFFFGWNPNAENVDGGKPIHLAVVNGHLPVVQYLAQRGGYFPDERDCPREVDMIALATLHRRFPIRQW